MSEMQIQPREVVLSCGYPPSPLRVFLHACDSLHGPLAPWPRWLAALSLPGPVTLLQAARTGRSGVVSGA